MKSLIPKAAAKLRATDSFRQLVIHPEEERVRKRVILRSAEAKGRETRRRKLAILHERNASINKAKKDKIAHAVVEALCEALG